LPNAGSVVVEDELELETRSELWRDFLALFKRREEACQALEWEAEANLLRSGIEGIDSRCAF
jgi:hypothetical protein